MDLIVQAPSRINLINPLDAVEGDFWMPSVAINGVNNPLSAFFYIKKIKEKSILKIYEFKDSSKKYEISLVYNKRLFKKKTEIQKMIHGKTKLIYASVNKLFDINKLFEGRYSNSNIEVGLLTTIPRQSGLGGSASIIIAILFGFIKYFDLFNNLEYINETNFPLNKDIIAELATEIESKDLNIVSGYSDRYVICRGGLCFCSYVGKLYHKKIGMEPLAIYDRIDKVYNINDLPIIVCYSGLPHRSGDVHGKLRALYLQGDTNVHDWYKNLAKISWRSRFALMKHDWNQLGNYFKENTTIMNQLMEYAGFKYGIGLANNILIKIIEDNNNVYAAKLTGAGGGGSVFALVNPNKMKLVINYWKQKLKELIKNKTLFVSLFPNYPSEFRLELINTKFYEIKINPYGVKEL